MIAVLAPAVGALLALAAPGAAAAAPSPADAADSAVTADSAVAARSVAAAQFEFDEAVPSGPPPAGAFCRETTGARVCFVANGDRWYVRDTDADSASADAAWENFIDPGGTVPYRAGICSNGLGAGNWGTCNKNYFEDTVLNFFVEVFDYSENRLVRRAGPFSTVT